MTGSIYPPLRLLPLSAACLMAFLGIHPVAYAADEVGIITQQRQVNVSGRGIATLRFEVENKTGQTQEFNETVDLPQGWFLLSTPAPFLLPAGSRDIRLIFLSVPRGIASGEYPIRYTVSASNNRSFNASETARVNVLGRSGLALTRLETPSNLLAGEAYKVVFQLKNKGNNPANYSLSVNDDDGYVDKISPKKLTLNAGEADTITVTGKIPKSLGESGAHQFILSAKGGGKIVEERVTIPLVARQPKGLGKYHSLYGLLTLSQSASSGSNQTQVEVALQGAIDRQGVHNISLKFRNGQSSSQRNNADQSNYNVGYQNKEWKVQIGHAGFSTGRLAGNSIAGIGAEIQYKPLNKDKKNALQLRAFSAESRSEATKKEKATGIIAQYRFNDLQVDIGGSLLNYAEEGEDKTTISSFNAGWTGEYLSIRGEFANDQQASARFLDITSQLGDVGLAANHLRGDTGFKGANEDIENNQLGFNWAINDRNRLDITARQNRSNLANDHTQAILATEEQRVNFSHLFGDELAIELAAAYILRDEKDLRDNPTTDKTTQSQSLRYRHSFDTVNISAEWEQGSRNDRINGNGSGSNKQLILDWKPANELNLSTTYSINEGLESNSSNQSLGFRGAYRFDRRRNISAFLQETQNDNTGITSDSFNLSYSHEFRNRHRLQLTANYTKSSGNGSEGFDDTNWRLQYSVPLSVPIRRRDDIGSLRGKAYFATTGEPAKNVIVDLDGQYAVTDQQGKFHYPNILAKDYELEIDSSRLDGSGYILGEKGSALAVSVNANQTERVKLQLQQGASLQGSLLTFVKDVKKAIHSTANEIQAELIEGEGLAGILIELCAMDETGCTATIQRRLTDSTGNFNFLGIAPGQWQLTVVDTKKIPKNFRLEKNNFMIDLQAGDGEKLIIKALPTEQTIKKQGPSGGFNVSG